MKKILALSLCSLCLASLFASSAARADTRGDFMNDPSNYSAVSVNKALPNGRVIAYDIPINSSLLGQQTQATNVAAHGKIYATSIAYQAPNGQQAATAWGIAKSPYAAQ